MDTKLWGTDFWTLNASKFDVGRDEMVYFYSSTQDPHWEKREKLERPKNLQKFREWLSFNQIMEKKACRCRACASKQKAEQDWVAALEELEAQMQYRYFLTLLIPKQAPNRS